MHLPRYHIVKAARFGAFKGCNGAFGPWQSDVGLILRVLSLTRRWTMHFKRRVHTNKNQHTSTITHALHKKVVTYSLFSFFCILFIIFFFFLPQFFRGFSSFFFSLFFSSSHSYNPSYKKSNVATSLIIKLPSNSSYLVWLNVCAMHSWGANEGHHEA